MSIWIKGSALLLAVILCGYPLAALMQHGYDTRLWPGTVPKLTDWFAELWRSSGWTGWFAYRAMLEGRAPSFSGGGFIVGWTLVGALVAGITIMAPSRPVGPRRDPNATYGDARLATLRERRRMGAGLELGRDPDTHRPIRVAVRSNLITCVGR